MPVTSTKPAIFSAARMLAKEMGIKEVKISIAPNLLMDTEGNTIIPSFILGSTKHDMLVAIKGAYYALSYYKDLGVKKK